MSVEFQADAVFKGTVDVQGTELDVSGGHLKQSGIVVEHTAYLFHQRLADIAVHPEAEDWSATGSQEVPQNNVNFRIPADLARYDEVRFTCRVQSAGQANHNLQAKYSDTSGGSVSNIGTGVNFDIDSTGYKNTGWIDLAAGAKADNVFLVVDQTGGGTIPDVLNIIFHFRARA